MTEDMTQDLPAIAGGAPAKRTPWGHEQRYGEEELQELKEALARDFLFYAGGTKVAKLEEDFARKNGVRFAVACSSGTSAVHSAMIALGISPGEEVIVPPITDMGSVIPILYQGGIPVFVDLHPYSYALQPEKVEEAITDRTRAVLAVHLWGNACDLDALCDICDRHGLALVEDCAQGFGCLYRGKPIGTFGKIGCFSLQNSKHISCGDGGLTITDDEELAKRLRLAMDKCYSRDVSAAIRTPHFLANNYRMTELQGAVAVAQLRKLDSIVERRRKWCTALSERLESVPGITLPTPTPGCDPSWWFYMLRVQPEILGVDADAFAEALRAEGLSAGAHYIGQCIYEYPIFVNHSAFERGTHPYAQRQYGKGLCPTAEAIVETCVILPVNQAYTEADLEETAHAVRRVSRWFVDGRLG